MTPQFWSHWKNLLRRGGLTLPVLTLLEDGGVFRSIIAQGMLAVSPFASSASESWRAFAEMLEDPVATQAFARHLRGEGI